MRKLWFCSCVFFAAGLLSAAQIQLPAYRSVSYDFSRTADFSTYKTYKWVSISNGDQLDELTADQLVGTLQVELGKRGLTRTPDDNPDLYIGYQITNTEQKPLASETIGGSYGSAGGASASAGASMNTVHSGLLTLLMYDNAKKLVWRGTVSNAIDADAKPDKKQDHMSKGIEKLLKNYPPLKK
jgi:Domain of unknown function (DUF4136)